MSRTRTVPRSFKYAFDGILEALKNEPNFRLHLIVGTIAVFLAFFLKFSDKEWLILISTISFVLIMELLNTSIEAIVDLVSPQIRHKAKVAKDVSAAAVLIASILAVIVGIVLYAPKIFVLQ
jgi:diacylglycerol kinase